MERVFNELDKQIKEMRLDESEESCPPQPWPSNQPWCGTVMLMAAEERLRKRNSKVSARKPKRKTPSNESQG